MINWNYDEKNVEQPSFSIIPVGDYRVRVESVTEEVSKNSGNDMLKFVLAVSGYKQKLFHYLVIDTNNIGRTNGNIKTIADAFGVDPNVNSFNSLQGKAAACRVKHRPYNGEMQASLSYFLTKERAADLPDWIEPENKSEDVPF